MNKYEKAIKERLEEIWLPMNAASDQELIEFLEKLKLDERLDAATKLAIEERISELK